MMRPLFVLLLAGAVFGSIAAYSQFLANIHRQAPSSVEPPAAAGKFSLVVIRSFDAERDAFSTSDSPAIVVRMAGQDLLRHDDLLPADQPLAVDDVPGISVGRNAFYLEAIPAADFINRPCAVQLQVLRDDQVLAESTLWSRAGGAVAGELIVDIK